MWVSGVRKQRVPTVFVRFPQQNTVPSLRITVSGSWEGTDRTQFLWRKPTETEAHLLAAPLVGTSMSWLCGPRPRCKVSSQNQGLSVVGHPPRRGRGGSDWTAEKKGWAFGDYQTKTSDHTEVKRGEKHFIGQLLSTRDFVWVVTLWMFTTEW